MKVLYIAAECKPFSKAGGVGDVAGELPPVLKSKGIDIGVVTPLYAMIKTEYIGTKLFSYEVMFEGIPEKVSVFSGDLAGVPVYFVKNNTYLSTEKIYIESHKIPYIDDAKRFSFFSKACLHLIEQLNPDIVHINDWVLGYLFGWMAQKKFPQKRVLTIHNIGYQGNLWRNDIHEWEINKLLEDPTIGPLFKDPREDWFSVNPLRLGMELADVCNTVSPNYAVEMLQEEDTYRYFEGGKGLERVAQRLAIEGKLLGILNGFNYTKPPSDAGFEEVLTNKAEARKNLEQCFLHPGRFILGFVGRAVDQKFHLLAEYLGEKPVLEHILDLPDVNVAILATGTREYEALLRRYEHHDNAYITIAYDAEKAKEISQGCDIFLMPSLYEPCGITQMESMANATPPLVRWTGGLKDTVSNFRNEHGTGFGFDGDSREEVLQNLIDTILVARHQWQEHTERYHTISRNAYFTRFTWDTAAKEYLGLYHRVMEH